MVFLASLKVVEPPLVMLPLKNAIQLAACCSPCSPDLAFECRSHNVLVVAGGVKPKVWCLGAQASAVDQVVPVGPEQALEGALLLQCL